MALHLDWMDSRHPANAEYQFAAMPAYCVATSCPDSSTVDCQGCAATAVDLDCAGSSRMQLANAESYLAVRFPGLDCATPDQLDCASVTNAATATSEANKAPLIAIVAVSVAVCCDIPGSACRADASASCSHPIASAESPVPLISVATPPRRCPLIRSRIYEVAAACCSGTIFQRKTQENIAFLIL